MSDRTTRRAAGRTAAAGPRQGLRGFRRTNKRAAADAALRSHTGDGGERAGAAIDDALLATLPKLQIISSFGVGYDHIDANAAAKRGIVVTHTPDVLTEEVADTAIGLLAQHRARAAAVRTLSARRPMAGAAIIPLSRATLRDRTVGMVGLGRIGIAIARRLEAFGVPVVYHTRQPRPEVGYRHYPRLSIWRTMSTR